MTNKAADNIEIEKVTFADIEARIQFYKSKTDEQLKLIVPHWAYGENIHHLFDNALSPRDKEYQIFLVDTKELISISEFHEVKANILFTGEILNDRRVASILYRWDNKKFVDPSSVGLLNRYKEKLCFSDGRHRAKTVYLLGHIQMPVAIHKTEIHDISKMIQLVPV